MKTSIKEASKPISPIEVYLVEAIIRDKEGKILLLKRSNKNRLFVGNWQLPGGKLEKNESTRSAIKRELKEELGGTCSFLKPEKFFSFSSDFTGVSSTVSLAVFSCSISPDLKLSIDHSDARFFSLAEIRQLSLTPISKKSIFD
ncbi:MAG: NUDIX hydrolase [archaeon]